MDGRMDGWMARLLNLWSFFPSVRLVCRQKRRTGFFRVKTKSSSLLWYYELEKGIEYLGLKIGYGNINISVPWDFIYIDMKYYEWQITRKTFPDKSPPKSHVIVPILISPFFPVQILHESSHTFTNFILFIYLFLLHTKEFEIDIELK